MKVNRPQVRAIYSNQDTLSNCEDQQRSSGRNFFASQQEKDGEVNLRVDTDSQDSLNRLDGLKKSFDVLKY